MNVFQLHCVDQHIVDAFEAHRPVFTNFSNMIARVVNVRITKHEQ